MSWREYSYCDNLIKRRGDVVSQSLLIGVGEEAACKRPNPGMPSFFAAET
ncbi:MAG: hypothetical protein IPH78_01110 [Bacteroidetes bacterium]|nr:hypothetical protein [Bacteroidota bacterium]